MMRRRSSLPKSQEERIGLVDTGTRSGVHGRRFYKLFFAWAAAAAALVVLVLLLSGGITHNPKSTIPNKASTTTSNVAPHWQSIMTDTGNTFPLLVSDNQKSTKWTLSSTDGIYTDISTPNKPGDIITDLMHAGIMQEPYMDNNFLDQVQIWAGNLSDTPYRRRPNLYTRKRTWIYSTTFELPFSDENTFVLVLEGIKMGATVTLNGKQVGQVTDQFLRYEFVIEPNTNEKNTLSIEFDPSISTNGRFMGCSGGWDWAPYVPIGDQRGSRLWTFGIFREAYIIASHKIYILHVVPKVYYTGKHPVSPMVNGPEADFQVVVQVHVVSPTRDYNGDGLVIELNADFLTPTTIQVPPLKADEDTIVAFNVTVDKENVKLWWPNGMGSQPLYSFQVRLVGKNTTSPWIEKRIGFRTAALVTINDVNTTLVNQAQQSEGSGNHGMYFRINGALVWARGGNLVPMDQLEGRLDDEAHRELVRSTAAANINMLRVWGGGMILPQAFYDACDEEGILLFHDFMFVSEHYHDARDTPTVTAELRHVVRSLSSHPSIVLWNGCNECSSLRVFADYVMPIVAQEDDTRAIWPSSPSTAGWSAGVRTLDSRPNGNTLTLGSRSRTSLERHGPYGHSYSLSYPTWNSVQGNTGTNIPPNLASGEIGPMFQNQAFASEFGSSVMSSFESMSATLSPENWNIHGGDPPASCTRIIGHDLECTGKNVLSQRNYACDSHIIKYFGRIPLEEEIGARPFQAQLYECMMGQALWMKGQFEMLRSQNSFGALIWQLNENWPTGGWGSIEYGTPSVKGQVIGGRWKPLMHMFQNSLLRDVFAACGRYNQCFVRNDGVAPVNVNVVFEYWKLSDPKPMRVSSKRASLAGGVAATERFELDAPSEILSQTEVVLIRVEQEDGDDKATKATLLMKDNAFLHAVPSEIKGLNSTRVDITTTVSSNADNRGASISLTGNHLALYVTLTTTCQGRFSENALHLRPNQEMVVEFEPPRNSPPVDVQELKRTLRVEHLGMYLQET